MRRLAIWLGAACVAWLALITALWNGGIPQASVGLPRILPDDPAIAMAEALSRYDDASKPPASLLQQVQKAARLDPLEDEPRLLLARTRMTEGKSEESIHLLEDARRLNPRSRATRLLLLQQYLLMNRSGGVVTETSALNGLMPQGRKWFISLLANLVDGPDTRRGMLAALPSHPLQIPVIEKLSADGAAASLLLAASPNLRGDAIRGESNQWVTNIVMPLVRRGDIAGARRLWAHFYGVTQPRADAVPFDGELAGLSGGPFGWRAISSPTGIAEIADGGLDLEYFGRKPGGLADQLISLPSGQYRLRFQAARTGGEAEDGLVWKIRCLDGANILRFPVTLSSDAVTYSSSAFTVPDAGCAAQWLRLEGEPALTPRSLTATITNISIGRM